MQTKSQKELLISDLFRGDLKLSSPPNIYFELQRVINNPKKSMSNVAFIIEKDASLSIKLLKIVNSAFYGFPSKISSITRAITLIGTKEIQSITLSTVVMDRFSNLPGELISMHDFWARSLRCALLAQGIDKFFGKEFIDSVFICGLLHNIGQLVFFRRIPELAREVSMMLQDKQNPTDIDEILFEKKIIGFDHYQTGSALSRLWKLPPVIGESIRLHAYPDNTETYHKIASIVRLADCYSKIDFDCCDIVIKSLGISTAEMSVISEKAYAEFEDIFKVFYPGSTTTS